MCKFVSHIKPALEVNSSPLFKFKANLELSEMKKRLQISSTGSKDEYSFSDLDLCYGEEEEEGMGGDVNDPLLEGKLRSKDYSCENRSDTILESKGHQGIMHSYAKRDKDDGHISVSLVESIIGVGASGEKVALHSNGDFEDCKKEMYYVVEEASDSNSDTEDYK